MSIHDIDHMKILLLDSEWFPNIGVFWRLGKQFVGHDQIIKERSMISTQFMWLEDNKPSLISISQNKKKFMADPYDDEEVVRNTHKLLLETNVVVCHNSRFDIRMFNARAFFYDLPPLPPIRVICTLKESRKVRELNCHKLDYIMKFKGHSGKIKMEWDDWIEIGIRKNFKRLKKMDRYGLKDVKDLKKMYLWIRPHMTNHPNWNLHSEGRCCPVCGSKRLKSQGIKNSSTRSYRSLRCLECRAYSQENISIRGVSVK